MARKHHDGSDIESESKALKWTAIISAAAIGLTVDYFWPGWGRPVLLTLVIFGSLVVFGKPWWSARFWLIAAGAFALHSALVLHFRTPINQVSMPALFLYAVVEIIAIGLLLGLAFPDRKQAVRR